MKIEGSVSIITGGASGLGESVVRYFLSQGGKVAIWDIDTKLGESLSSSLGQNSLFCQVDVTSEQSVSKGLSEVISKFGRVDILVNSAGIILGRMMNSKSSIHPIEEFEKVIKVNVTGTFIASKIVARQMTKQEEVNEEKGVIVHVASIAAFEGMKGNCAYASSKGAIVGLTLPMARDLKRHKIRVNSIAPGVFLDTRLMKKQMSEEYYKRMTAETLMGRGGRNEEFAHSIRFLIENTYMNGTVVRCDGGMRLPNI